jgi:phosphoserine phosphatase
MAETVITIVGSALGAGFENRAAQLVKETGVDDLRFDWLQRERAFDILVKQNTPALMALLRAKLAALRSVDIFVQPDDLFRKKKLLVADMDATMIQQETLDELAAHLNIKDKIAPITEKAMRGEIDFYEALRMRVKMLRGLPVTAIFETIGKIRYSPGAAALVKTMNRHGAKCVLVSGGFDLFTGPVAETLGFYKNVGNRLGIEDQKLTGEVIPPIVDKHVKEQLVADQAKVAGCDLKHVVAIGDGANDIPMLKKAGTGIGYYGKPAVVEATPHQIRYTDLASVLYMQGYRQAEIAE